MAIRVQVEGAWLLVSGADAGELWIALHDVRAVGTAKACEVRPGGWSRDVWAVVIEQAGRRERCVYVEDEDAAEALAAEVRPVLGRAHERRVA